MFIVLLIAEQGEYPGGIRVLLEIVSPRNKQNCILLVIKVSGLLGIGRILLFW